MNSLRAACAGGHYKCVKLLLDAGEACSIDTIECGDILINVCKRGYRECVQLLINAGANCFYKTSDHGQEGLTAVHIAALGNDSEIMKILLSTGIPVSSYIT